MRVANGFDVGDTSDELNSVNSVVAHANDHVTEASTCTRTVGISQDTIAASRHLHYVLFVSIADSTMLVVNCIYMLGHCLVK